MLLITFAFERERRILLVRFALDLSRETLTRLDSLVRRFAALEGPADCIIDFSAVPPGSIDMALAHERSQQQLVMPGQERVFVAPGDQLFGVLRVYAARQDKAPLVVRTIDAAYHHYGVAAAGFQLLDIDPAAAV